MEKVKNFSAETEEALWQQLTNDLNAQKDILEYTARLQCQGKNILFNIDVDLGGGFEGGFETTTFSASVPGNNEFNFHLYPQDWVNEIGKLFGMEDIELGIPELDKAFIIKTNQPEKLRTLFADPAVQTALIRYPSIHLKLAQAEHDVDVNQLSAYFYEAITDPAKLREVYHLLSTLLDKVNPPTINQNI